MNTPTHLIIVAGHAVYTALDYKNPEADENWYLQSFQEGEPKYYLEHIHEGVRLLIKDSNAILLFSGGMTRKEAGRISEAESYLKLAQNLGYLNDSLNSRTSTEIYAKNSLENLQFSIARFQQIFKKQPEKITLISWGFKKERFEWHCKTVDFPLENFHFIGVNQPENLDKIEKHEAKTLAHFKKDPWGTKSPLKETTEKRNPFGVTHNYTNLYIPRNRNY